MRISSAPTKDASCLASAISMILIVRSLIVRGLLYGRSAAKLGKDLAHGQGQRALDRTTAGAFVATAAETLGHAGNIEFALAAQADAVTAVGQFAEKCRHLHFADGENVVHQAFAVFFFCRTTVHLLLRYRYPGEASFLVQVAQGFAQQTQLGHRLSEVDALSAVRGIRPGEDQLPSQGECLLIG